MSPGDKVLVCRQCLLRGHKENRKRAGAHARSERSLASLLSESKEEKKESLGLLEHKLN